MATRANIVVQRSDKKFARIYTHWDGYPAHHGPLLLNHYNTQQLAEKLVSFGDISVLAESADKPPEHSYSKPAQGYNVYYGRDRQDKDTEVQVFDSFNEAVEDPEEHVYFWSHSEGRWAYLDKSGGLIPLGYAISERGI